MPLFLRILSQILMMPYSSRPGSSSQTDVRPFGRDNGESIETTSGPAANVDLTKSSSVLIIRVTASLPANRHHPDGRDSEPVISIPTTLTGWSLAARDSSPRVIAGPVGPL